MSNLHGESVGMASMLETGLSFEVFMFHGSHDGMQASKIPTTGSQLSSADKPREAFKEGAP